jgi:hypothetical protein
MRPSAPVTVVGVVGQGGIIVSIPIKHVRERQMAFGCLPVLLLLSGCGAAEPECDSPDIRNSVIKVVSDDSHNALVNYAAKNSSAVAAMLSKANSDAEKSAILEKARQGATYRLDDPVRANSRKMARRTVTCSALLYATVEDATAQKQVDFKVEQAADGTMSISVSPFQF